MSDRVPAVPPTSPSGKEGPGLHWNTVDSASLRREWAIHSMLVTQCVCDKVQIKYLTAPGGSGLALLTGCGQSLLGGGEDKAWALSNRYTIDSFQSFPFCF